MNRANFITHLKRTLPVEEWPWVLSALRQDALIWESLDGVCTDKLLARQPGSAADYSPAALALLLLEYPADLTSLQSDPIRSAGEETIQEAPAAGEPEVITAARLALRWREERVKRGEWQFHRVENSAVAAAALAFLYTMVPSPPELLEAVMASAELGTGRGIQFALHTVLCQPLSPAAQLAIFDDLAIKLMADDRLALLAGISALRPGLADGLARHFDAPPPEITHPRPTPETRLYQLSRLLQTAKIKRLARQSGHTQAAYEEALHTLHRLEAMLSAHLALTLHTEGSNEQALPSWEAAHKLDPNAPEFLAGWVLALLEAKRSADAEAHLASANAMLPHPALLLARARLAHQRGRIDEARGAARQALDMLAKTPASAALETYPPASTLLDERLAASLAALLLELNLPQDAIQAGRQALIRQPVDPDRMALLAEAHRQVNEISQALEYAHLAVALAPERVDLRELLAECLEGAGDWENALSERIALVDLLAQPSKEDMLRLATCALNAGQAPRTIEICQQVIAEHSEDGLAYALLGEAKGALGDTESALESLQHAVQVTPQHPETWLALARFYHQRLQPQKTLETLQAAVHAAPELPELHLALGEILLEMNAPTQALEALRKAAEIVFFPKSGLDDGNSHRSTAQLSTQIGLRLGQTLRRLGHTDEARRVLEEAYHLSPAHPGLAHAYAETLIDLEEYASALEPLEAVLASNPRNIAPYVEYARCLFTLPRNLRSAAQIDQAVIRLQVALELDPQHAEAQAWLAESLAASDRPQDAIRMYRLALDSDLADDRSWRARLTLGLGNTALQLGQIETAIAALREASQLDPQDASVQCSLSEAYDAAGLADEALQAAREALLLAPTDIEVLTWFASQALNIGRQSGTTVEEVQQEALQALVQATQLAPQRTDLLVRLAQTQARLGNHSAALATYQMAAQITNPTSPSLVADLYQAAEGLTRLGDAAHAAACLEKALQSGGNAGGYRSPSILELLKALAKARARVGNLQAALQALDQAIELAPDDPNLYLDKASLLLDAETGLDPAEGSRQALACLQRALELDPHNLDLNLRAASIHQIAGDLQSALVHAERMLASPDASPIQRLNAMALAADLALAVAQPERAYTLLDFRQPVVEKEDLPDSDLLPYLYLRTELALQAGDDRIAIDGLAKIIESDAENPRSVVIQARLALRRGDHANAEQLFTTASELLQHPSTADLPALRTAAEAALELHQWAAARAFAAEVSKLAPHEPRSHLLAGRILTLQAEFQQLCATLDAVHHAPGEQALSASSYAECIQAVSAAEACLARDDRKRAGDTPGQAGLPPEIRRWRARAQAIYKPAAQSAKALASLPPHPDDIAAQVACLSRIGEMNTAGIAAREFPANPHVLLRLALALAQDKPRRALAAVRAAAETLSRPQGEYRPQTIYGRQEMAPFIHILTARLLHSNGNRATDSQSALQAVQAALQKWPEEPHWHVLAADIYLTSGEPGGETYKQAALAHLERAVELAPAEAAPWLRLGHVYLKDGSRRKAIQAYEEAVKLDAENAAAWLALAAAYRAAGDLEQAATHAERAVTLAPDEIEPLLLRGEIALQSNNPRGAQTRAKAALRIAPNDPAALLLLVRALLALDQEEEALALLEDALGGTSEPLPLALEHVRLLNKTRSPAESFQAIERLHERYPEEPAVLALLTEAYAGAQQVEQAIRTAQQALRNQAETTTLPPVEAAHLHAHLGELLRRTGQLDQAIHHLNEAILLAPHQPDLYLQLGHIHQERREYNQALDAFTKATAVAPGDHRAYHQIGLALKESRDYAGAERMLRKAAELAPNDLGIHRLLAAVVALNLVHNRRETAGRVTVQS